METVTNSTTMVEVRNRNNGFTGYTLANGVKRIFNLGQIRKISLDELRELRDTEGGEYILQNYLIVNDVAALEYLDIETEPEYFYTEKEIEILLRDGSLDQLEDALNFAPQGVIDLIKDMAVKTELSDIKKRDLITKKTGFSITNAIQVNKILAEDTETKEEEPEKVRKAAPVEKAESKSGRKAAPIKADDTKSKYTFVD